jgi:hypothetical protein
MRDPKERLRGILEAIAAICERPAADHCRAEEPRRRADLRIRVIRHTQGSGHADHRRATALRHALDRIPGRGYTEEI